MPRVEFLSLAGCDWCPLGAGEHLDHPGLPTRPWDGFDENSGHRKALLIVGSHPGLQEDTAGVSFIGPTGQRTNELYVRETGLHNYADVYLTNAVRCAPRSRETISPTCVKRCRGHLERDITELAKHYDEVVVLATGEKAIMSVMGHKVPLRSFPHGLEIDIAGVNVRVFATWLAVQLLPGYDPSKLADIAEHLAFLRTYLREGRIPTMVMMPASLVGDAVPDPTPDIRELSLDIETYGCCAGYPDQTVYHPRKSLHWDRVQRRDLVLTVGLGWRDSTGELRAKVYRMWRSDDRRRLRTVLRSLRHPALIGSNIAFDIMYLWEFDPQYRKILNVDTVDLYELSVWSFLDNDQRSTRGLKALALLLGVENYRETESLDLRAGQRYDSKHDARLISYQARDVLVGVLVYEILVSQIAEKFGTDTCKLTGFSRQWFSDLSWLAVEMQYNGIRYDIPRLQRAHTRCLRITEHLLDRVKQRFNVKLAGKNSNKDKQRMVDAIIAEFTPDPDEDPTEYATFRKPLATTKTGQWCCNKENREYLLGIVPSSSQYRAFLLAWRRYTTFAKIIESYTSTMLAYRQNKSESYEGACVHSTAYPRWFPVPTYDESSDTSGGTKQGRITSKDPATQTQPPIIERCQKSRFPGGAIVRVDASQIELRVATILSGDETFASIFQGSANIHAETASLVAGRPITKTDDPQWYHAGKTLNFLTLFFGGADKFQQTCLREAGLCLSRSFCATTIQRFNRQHRELREWQERLIDTAEQDGYVLLEPVGIHRTFLGDVRETYVPTIVNFPVQSIAAMLTESAMFKIWRELRSHGLRTLTIGNTYDEGIYDVPADEIEIICPMLYDAFVHPPLYRDLLELGYTKIPLDAEVSGVYNTGRKFRWTDGCVNFT